MESLSRLIENKTIIIIAHRMSTITGADQIVVLSEGTVAEQSSSDTLLKKNGIYRVCGFSKEKLHGKFIDRQTDNVVEYPYG